MVLGPVPILHRHHRHPPPTGKQLFQRQLHGVPGRRDGGGTTGMLGKVCEATSRAMRALGIETNEDKTEVLNKGGPVDMPTEYIRPFARVLGAGVANDPESELITPVCATQGGGNRPPVPSHCGAAICKAHAVAAPLGVGAATRDVPATDACPRTHAGSGGVVRRPRHWSPGRHHGRPRHEARTRHCGPPGAPGRVRSPTAEGDCGVRLRVSWREGEATRHDRRVGCKHQSDLYETLQGPDRKVFVSNTAAGAGRPLTDPQVHADDRGFSTYLRERLLMRVLPEGQKCVCGADASNEHVHTCTRLQQNPRTTRHDMINMTFRKWVAAVRIPMRHGTAPDGGKPAATGHPHRRTRHVRDHRRDRHVRRAGHCLCVGGVHGRADPLRAARIASRRKRQKYRHWALANGLDFEPFVMLTNGAIHPQVGGGCGGSWATRTTDSPSRMRTI
ncbi:putative SLACS reverse transcriptase [Trypanosoma cruzi]|nr:putative SLACS reverse transcriptase [Trypanosoma cruzi]